MKKESNDLNRASSMEEVQMAKKTHEEIFNITGHKRNANQNTLNFYLTPVIMVTIKSINNSKCW
jgi:hypothetical protein